MAEPRMRQRHKGQQFATADLEAFLFAFGDDQQPLPETIKVLDEIVTDFVIETCHAAALSATYSHRAKIKVDDFKWALRKDPRKLGRVTELLAIDKDIKLKRKAFEVEEEAAVQRQGKRGRMSKEERQTLGLDPVGKGPGRKAGKKKGGEEIEQKGDDDDDDVE